MTRQEGRNVVCDRGPGDNDVNLHVIITGLSGAVVAVGTFVRAVVSWLRSKDGDSKVVIRHGDETRELDPKNPRDAAAIIEMAAQRTGEAHVVPKNPGRGQGTSEDS
jgi:hypothetical protein